MIEAETIKTRRETEIFVILRRYGNDYWTASGAYKTLSDAENYVRTEDEESRVWRIVRVSGLPVKIAEGEV